MPLLIVCVSLILLLQYLCAARITQSYISRVATLLCTFLVDVVLYALWRCLIRPKFSALRDLPQPPTSGKLLTGHVGAVFSTPLGRQITRWMNDIPNNGLLFFRGVLGAEYLVVTGVEGLRDVLFAHTYDFEKTSGFRRYTRRFLASGLVVQEGEAHKMRRKAVGPVFQPRNVDLSKPLLSAKAEVFTHALRNSCSLNTRSGEHLDNESHKSAVIDICDWANRFALDVACTVGFGEDFGLVQTREIHPILQAYKTIFTGSKEKMSQYSWHNTAPAWLVRLIPHKIDEEMDKAARVIRQMTYAAVQKRMNTIENGEKPPADFLTEVILCGKFNAQQCADELVILLAAAFESTAALVAMTMYQLCKHPDLQSALRHELCMFGLCAGRPSSIQESQYEKMPMLNAVLNEMMRLEPPLPITMRKAVRDTIVGGHVVKAGTYILLSPYAMGRSRNIWGPSALEFNPYRWITPFDSGDHNRVSQAAHQTSQHEQAATMYTCPPYGELNEHGGSLANHQFGMLAFLKGPKGCTGERFAKAQMRRTIAALVAEFKWTSAQPHEPSQVGIVVVKPEGGIQVRIENISYTE